MIFKKISLLSMAILVPAMGQAKSNEISLTTMLGSDSNPYKFAHQYSVEASQYMDLDLKGKVYLSRRWSSVLQWQTRQYQQQEDWADKEKASVALQYKGRSKKHPSAFEVRLEQQDKTYVSRLNGGLSTYSGESLDDRYDYTQLNLKWQKQHKLNKGLAWQYEVKFKQKNYQDFNNLAITDLDYRTFTLGNVFEHKINKRQKDEFSANVSYRLYTHREKVDISGADMANTQLGYIDAALAYEHTLKISKRHKLAMALGYDKRVDNGSGYYDNQKAKIEFRSRYRLSGKGSLTTSYQFSDFAYDRASNQGQAGTIDEYGANQKHQLKFNGKISLSAYLPMNAQWLMGYRFEQVTADKAQYSYERHQLETGLKFEL